MQHQVSLLTGAACKRTINARTSRWVARHRNMHGALQTLQLEQTMRAWGLLVKVLDPCGLPMPHNDGHPHRDPAFGRCPCSGALQNGEYHALCGLVGKARQKAERLHDGLQPSAVWA